MELSGQNETEAWFFMRLGPQESINLPEALPHGQETSSKRSVLGSYLRTASLSCYDNAVLASWLLIDTP
jgi:hypothetical protein